MKVEKENTLLAKFKSGDKVYDKADVENNPDSTPGEVIGIHGGKVVVNWNTGAAPGDYITKEDPHLLMEEHEAKVMLAVVHAEHNRLEAEFNAMKEQVISKIEVAASLMAEITDIIKSHDVSLGDLRKEIRPLFQPFLDIGWRASTIQC